MATQVFNPDKFRAARQAAGLSRTRLAWACNLSHYTITEWEQGRTTPRLNNLAEAAAALGVNVTEFFEEVVVDA